MYTEEPNERTTTSIYKKVFNKHRRRPDDPSFIGDLDEIVDFSGNAASDPRIVDLSKNSQHNAYQGPIYGLKTHPGFAYIPSALSPKLQRDFAYKALTEFCQPPHGTNIDLIPMKEGIEIPNVKDDEQMWELWKKENVSLNVSNTNIDDPICKCEDQFKKENHKDCEVNKKRYYKRFDKLAWATLGYRFDWTARAYREKNKSAMPTLLHQLGCFFAKVGEEINPKNNGDVQNYSFTASAAIVNYYSLKSSMGGHRDDSELDMTKPVVSFSLGLPAVFMVGGKTREEGPVVPLLLRPGDVMLLGGESRLNFHGIARILSEEVKLPAVGSHIGNAKISDFQIDSWSEIFQDEIDIEIETPSSDFEAIKKFLSQYRINANVRQVLPDGVDRIPGDEFND